MCRFWAFSILSPKSNGIILLSFTLVLSFHSPPPFLPFPLLPHQIETLECLKEFIDEADIPVEYGGKLRFGEGMDTARFKSPQEVALREHVLAVNKKHGVEMVVDAKMKERETAI